jgi:hypothetical protein
MGNLCEIDVNYGKSMGNGNLYFGNLFPDGFVTNYYGKTVGNHLPDFHYGLK